LTDAANSNIPQTDTTYISEKSADFLPFHFIFPKGHKIIKHIIMEAVQNVLEKLHVVGKDEKGAPQKEPTSDELKQLRDKYEKAEQDQVLAFYDTLSTEEKANLYRQLADIDPDHINKITQRALNPPKAESEEKESGLEPLPENATASILDSKAEDIEKWYESGLDLIAGNKVAVVLMAGGQGTRLGSSAPKGCFDIGLPSQKSLFQIQAERIRKIERLAHKKSGDKDSKVAVPWYVMTSGPTRGPTEEYFKEHNYFGLEKENVVIFEQGVLPCISNDGKILLESKGKVRVFRNLTVIKADIT
jgi:UDP-N-acetylglucosamine/UDP-N-acetylgalactosamine diphosphorylase